MEIITGYTGKPHVTSEQDRDVNIGVVGEGSYVLQTGMQLAAEVSSNNEIKIRDGVLMHQGCTASIKKNTYDSLTIINGSQGMKRIDLIVARYEKNQDNRTEGLDLKVIQGTPAESNPVVPEYTEGDIQAGDYVADMPMYQVIIDGLNITEVKKVFEVAPGIDAMKKEIAELNSNIKILNSKKDSGHALKVFNASENLVYGCWDDGLYRYPGYYSGNGAPSDWAGIMLVSPIFVNGEINGFLKVAWDMSMTQYIMKNNKDGSVSQAWTKM